MPKPPSPPAAIEEPLYILPALVSRWGPATEADALVFVEGLDRAALVEEGRRVSTSRIDTDSARLLGIVTDFLANATEEQRDVVPALTDSLVRTAVWTCHQAKSNFDARNAQRESSGVLKDTRAAEAAAVFDKGKACREQLRSSLRALAGQGPAIVKKIEAGYGTAADAAALAKALGALIDIGRGILADSSPAMVKRRKGSRLDKAWLDRAAALADEVKRTGDAARAVLAAPPVPQADVDYWDGLSLDLLGTIIDLCEAGHEADPSIPRLVPIALRSYFNRRSSKPASPDADPAEPTTTGDK